MCWKTDASKPARLRGSATTLLIYIACTTHSGKRAPTDAPVNTENGVIGDRALEDDRNWRRMYLTRFVMHDNQTVVIVVAVVWTESQFEQRSLKRQIWSAVGIPTCTRDEQTGEQCRCLDVDVVCRPIGRRGVASTFPRRCGRSIVYHRLITRRPAASSHARPDGGEDEPRPASTAAAAAAAVDVFRAAGGRRRSTNTAQSRRHDIRLGR